MPLLCACAKDIVELTGTIAGIVKDYDSGDLIANCQVSLSPGGKSTFTDIDGSFAFDGIDPGTYTLAFARNGFENETREIEVISGQEVRANVALRAKSSFSVASNICDFGDLEVTQMIFFSNNSDMECSYTISNLPEWLSLSRTEGTVKAASTETVTAIVDRDKVIEGSYSQNLTVAYAGRSSGAEVITVKMTKVKLTVPTVTISAAAQNLKETGFDISGAIVATGGSQIISYGHCWSRNENPTVSGEKTDLGTTSASGSFTSTLTNLTTLTTYYVRAYAVNAQGIAYSEQVAITTQDAASDKWDGSVASSFARGNGTATDPYVIMTGGQLMLLKNIELSSSNYFELGGNIDLDNKNWKPFAFEGHLDGKGYTISNLYIDRDEDNQGLFSSCSRSIISNLTIKGVKIDAPSCNNIGALCGTASGQFINCHVILGSESVISGNKSVGGIIGGSRSSNLKNCSVASSATTAVIKGSDSVGGLVGSDSYRSQFERNIVKAEITGGTRVGGLVGYSTDAASINDCFFEGILVGEDYVGGFVGDGRLTISGGKVVADITAKNGYAGGLVCTDGGSGLVVYGCYSSGTINASAQAGGLIADRYSSWQRSYSKCHLSYSTMESSSDEFYGLGDGSYTDCATVAEKAVKGSSTNTKAGCTDITKFFREAYSKYADYWNYDHVWKWKGTIQGEAVEVSCPKLSWEE